MIPALFIAIIILIIVIMVKSSNKKDYKEHLGRKDWSLDYAQERIAAYQKQEDVLKKSKESLDAAINDFHKKQDAFWEDANQELQKKRNEVLKECEIYWEKIDKKNQAKQEQLKKRLWENCQKYMEDKAVSMPWLAAGMVDFLTLQEDLVIQELESGNNRRDWDRAIKINDLKKKKALIKDKKIHEKHICQLCGSALEYKIACNPSKEVILIFVTHTNISDKARTFAHALNVAVKENVDLQV